MDRPKVTVLMPTYNASAYLKEAIESILGQSFQDFEFLIVDDGSEDQTGVIVSSYRDKRIRLLYRKHRGLIRTLNDGIIEARGEYIARMDADDISLPDRLILQTKFLDKNLDYVLVGTTIEAIDEQDRSISVFPEPTDNEDLIKGLLVRNVFAHGSVMVRKEAADKCHGYSNFAIHAEDYDLWTRLAKRGKIANLPQVLYKWRVNSRGISQTKIKEMRATAKKVSDREWEYYKSRQILPKSTYKEVLQKKFFSDPQDRNSSKRRSALAGIYALTGNRYLLDGKRKDAFREITQAVVVSPLRVRNYFYLAMLLIPSSLLIPIESAIKYSALRVYKVLRGNG